DDTIAYLNKAMTFLSAIAASRFPSTNNQLRTSSNSRNQATIQDGRVTVQQVQGRCYLRETFILEEVSRSKMLAKQNNPISKEKKINTSPINYVELNQLSEDFGKRFVPQQELSAEQAFWLQTSHPNTNQFDISLFKIEAHRELPKVSLENTSLKKLKYHLGKFDTAVKKRITSDAITEGEWGFEHTKVCSIDKQCFEIHKKERFLDNDRLLHQIMSQDVLLTVMNSINFYGDFVNLEMKKSESCNKCIDLEAELVTRKNMAERDVYTKLSNSFAKLEKHYISLELDIQLNQQIFQKDKSCDNQHAPEFLEYFEDNDLKAQLQEKDTTINKLRKHIKSLRESNKKDRVKQDMDEIKTINIELEHSVAKSLSENKLLHKEIEHLKKIYKEQLDSIKKTCTLSKEHYDSLIAQLNSKSMENVDLKGQIHEKVFVTTTLQNELRRLKSKNVLNNATTIALGMFKPNLDPLAPRIQELLVDVRDTCPTTNKPRLKSSTSASRSQPTGTKKNDRISQTPSSNIKNKVEVQLRRANLSSNKKNRVKDPICDANVKHTMLNANSELICIKCKQCVFDSNHDVCFLDFVNDVNVRSKFKSAKQSKQHNIWKPKGKVFTEIGYKWKPTGKMFTLVGNSCPLTRITSTKVMPIKETTSHLVETQNLEIKAYSKRPKQVKSIGLSKKSNIVESRISNNSEPNHSWGSNATDVPSSSSLVNDSKFLGTIRFRNDQIAMIMGYGDYQLGNVTISRVYYVEGLGHNLFSIGQFCDSDLEVAFRKNTCFIQNLDGVDLLSGSKDTNLYTISLDDMLKTFPICLLSKYSNSKSWLWHRRLSHLNFGTLNQLAKDGLARGIPKLKFKKDRLCSACALGKIKKSSHQPKVEDTNQEKLYLLHMDLCGLMRVEGINGKKYILGIVDDYSQFTWVKFLRSKDEAPDAIIKCIKNIQVRLNAIVRNVRTNNGTEFVNQTLRDFL
ncbi:retrovirus-related pol polyprotein from transposon TNT 1-94, partial [Tanacetum coccineum]